MCAYVQCEPSLRFLSNNGAKHAHEGGLSEVWTVLSSASFGQAHKAPQEFLEGTEKEAESLRIAQRISATLHKENTRSWEGSRALARRRRSETRCRLKHSSENVEVMLSNAALTSPSPIPKGSPFS